MLEATLALATVIRCAEICSIDADFPMIVPFTTVAAKPIRAQVKARAQRRAVDRLVRFARPSQVDVPTNRWLGAKGST
jgi:hypothetical protein